MNRLFDLVRQKLSNNPTGFFILFYTEMWEIFGRFGVMAVLVLYLNQHFHFSDSRAFEVYSAFLAMIYITPILGGLLADRYLGYRHAIILGGVIMTLGNLLVAVPTEMGLYLGLTILSVGYGFFCPSIVPLVGFLYERDERGRDIGFTLYYLAKNLGVLFAPICCGIVGHLFGYNYAFLLSAFGMLSGLLVFCLGQKQLQHIYHANPHACRGRIAEGNRWKMPAIYLGVLCSVPLIHMVYVMHLVGYLLLLCSLAVCAIIVRELVRRSDVERGHLLAIILLMLFVVLFSALLGQGGTTLNLFIHRMVNRHVLGLTIPTPIFYALDPIFMMILGPVLASFWLALAKRRREPGVVGKLVIGLGLLCVGFLVFTVAGYRTTLFGPVSVWYVILGYAIFPMAELCMIPIGLSMVTRLAPKDIQAMMVGVWMLGLAAAGYFTGIISKFGKVSNLTSLAGLEHAGHIYQILFLVTAGILLLGACLLFLLRPVCAHLMRPPFASEPSAKDSELAPLV